VRSRQWFVRADVDICRPQNDEATQGRPLRKGKEHHIENYHVAARLVPAEEGNISGQI